MKEISTKKIDRGSNHYEKETKNKYVFTHTQKKKQRKGVIKQTCGGLKFNIKVKKIFLYFFNYSNIKNNF